MKNEYYRSDEKFLNAIADAMHEEYKAITDAGFLLQIDDPDLADAWQIQGNMRVPEYRKFAELRIEALNRHEHEWRVWEDVKLPEGKVLIPGVVGHATDFIEHPELVAERLIKYANLVGRERVVAGTDCGLGTRVGHPKIAWAKFQALVEGAQLATKQLWG
jgi:5-methyltetrahydropteroyltriglutamate--homocysteine methyltransferase